MVVSKVWQLVKRPQGLPTLDDFKLIEQKLPPCSDGDVIVEAVCLSVDPYMRYKARDITLGSTMYGSHVARVTESKNEAWKVGALMVTYLGWRTHTHIPAQLLNYKDPKTQATVCYPLPDMEDLPTSLGIGLLGMPGNTAYFGLLELCEPKAGDTVLVNGAAGAVGSAVVQIAKIKGCKVIAFAGSDEKVAWVKELGADHVFNYKTTDVGKALTETAPQKINCYFDNVGGQFTADVLPHMQDLGRVALCGAISTYNDEKQLIGAASLTSPFHEGTLIWKELRVEGFLVTRYTHRKMEAFNQMKQWCKEGKLKYKETITEGFENMPKAFIGLFHGDNIGKAVVMP
ncbi:hypothetical protein Pmani_017684 [Petrolisthes manimaculis]|uniref:Prostaglandin reductase 1 n=1 Tax=Petrolisthes manimaculis TaxID=1843537 RepID=A0AAE1PNY9_9EUCA|nr:hypothetical protein Pmani_017684 [Petrolisthes manimaculis]